MAACNRADVMAPGAPALGTSTRSTVHAQVAQAQRREGLEGVDKWMMGGGKYWLVGARGLEAGRLGWDEPNFVLLHHLYIQATPTDRGPR